MPGCRPAIVALLGGLCLAGSLAVLPAGAAARHAQAAGRAKAHQAAPAAPVPAGPPPVAPLALPGMPPPPALADEASYVLMDATTGTIIAAKAPDLRWPPASLAKLMTAYLIYQQLAHGSLKVDQEIPVSVTAWRTGGSRMFISPTTTVTVDQLLHGLIINSGNDATVALAQAAAGTRGAFVQMMNAAAAKLELAGTHYTNVTGLPDPDMYSTAMDVARLSRAFLAQYPAVLKISVHKHYTFDKIRQRSWNPVLFHDPTVDGLKTGRTTAAGHCIDATALRDGHRLIAVVLGGPNWSASTKAIEALLDYGYQFYTDATIAEAGRPVGSLTDAKYQPETVPVGAGRDVVATVPIASAKTLSTTVTLDAPAGRAIARGAVVGQVTVSANGKPIATVPAVALAPMQPAGFVTLLMRRARNLF